MARADTNITRNFRQMREDVRIDPGGGGGARADYNGGTTSTFRRERAGLYGDADAHIVNDVRYFKMIEYVRDMDRNDFLLGQIVDRLCDNVIRDDADLECQTGDKDLDKALWQDDYDWAMDRDKYDVAGRYTRPEMSRLAYRHRNVDGDCFVVGTEEGKVQRFEADQCRTPNGSIKRIVHGVELDGRGRKVRYYFTKPDATIMRRLARVQRVSDTTPIDAIGPWGPQVWHCLRPGRFSTTRGITAFHAVFDLSGQADDLLFAELVKRQVIASQSIVVETAAGATPSDSPTGERTTETLGSGYDRVLEKVVAGSILRLKPGQQAKVLGATLSAEGMIDHLRFLVQAIGNVINFPLVMITLDASEGNFSSIRGVVDSARLSFVCEQKLHYSQYHRPEHHWRVRRRLEDDDALGKMLRRRLELSDGQPTIFRHAWHGKRWTYIQPMQDAQAHAVRLQTGQISPRRLHSEIGSDFETFVAEAVADNAMWIRAAVEAFVALKTDPKLGSHLHDLTWRDFYHRDFYRGGQLVDTADPDVQRKADAEAKAGK